MKIVLIVYLIMINEYNNSADLNSDGSLDILDIILLVNIKKIKLIKRAPLLQITLILKIIY